MNYGRCNISAIVNFLFSVNLLAYLTIKSEASDLIGFNESFMGRLEPIANSVLSAFNSFINF